ncbi:uncharacterized protein J7T54_001593 [Emericellopsis cladophorae]|uniref:Uncharacterized protein n=1 Tax=Emericellopsis cladophorae TaxID=2686198 RepID=A0A9P9Y565_9HYPO|nr:uncharacterized protein J7T54_001593 [Emericellopsis cladophorae]KAI6783717.1 hypothetical protein J7T54_001593 [Emericellopsis cladophorae]
MEPVPETERMEEFRSSPVPSLRLNPPSTIPRLDLDTPSHVQLHQKPPNYRRSTDPSPTSPSNSSCLETIPDSPDAEEAALEAERVAQLKAAAEAAEGGDSADGKSRGALDVPARGRTMTFGSRDKRKRWSVCGAERRGDIDLETIWED